MSQQSVGVADVVSQGTKSGQGQHRRGPLATIARAFRRHPLWMSLAAGAIAAIVVLAYGGYFMGWAWTGFQGNTFWDWMSLLITPVTLAIVSIVFGLQQNQGSIEMTSRQQQESLLEAYFDHITHLLLESHLLETSPDSPVRAVARARTAATLQQVGQQHRAAILRFLDESGLTSGSMPVLDLRNVKLDGQGAAEIA